MGKKRRVLNPHTGVIYDTVNEAAESVGVSYRAVSNVLNGYCKSAGGVEWRDVDGEW